MHPNYGGVRLRLRFESAARDARAILWEIVVLRDRLAAGDTEHALRSALYLGTLAERIAVRLFEPLVQRDKKRQAGAGKGGRTRAEQSAEFQAEYRLIVERLLTAKQKTSHSQICIEAADIINGDHGETVVKAEAIRRNTRDLFNKHPRPGKKRGPKPKR